MDILYINYSTTYIENGSNSSTAKTHFPQCVHMPAMMLFYLSLQVINLCLGVPANLMVLWLLHKNKKDSSTSDIFIMHLAILDTLFCLIPPLELVNLMYMTISSIGYVLRFFYGLKDSTPLFLSCICLDRYMAVTHPITFSALKDGPHRSVCGIILWLITVTYAMCKYTGSAVFDKVFTGMILATFAIMLFCNVSILWALKRSGPGKDEMHPVKKRAFKMVVIILAIIVFNYLPPVALFPFQEYFSKDIFNCYINYLVFGFMDISSSIQPMLYLSKEKLSCPPCCCKGCGDAEVHSVEPSV